ncbi:MAG: band 7 protein [Elusimicrobia bacterium CG08_land_8_20_14_0_20_59_10]|nr:MAG: band 7 protein [Elusimicrobia bacterium CG08_land_8_20_14_0_20_59_10]
MLFVNFLVLFGGIGLIVTGAMHETALLIFGGIFTVLLAVFLFCGFFALQPNEARVMVLFGDYKGVVRDSGFFWASPLYSRSRGGKWENANGVTRHVGEETMKMSLRARNFECQKLKVNDKGGNPIEIAAVVVWSVTDAAQALFDVDRYESYVQVQSETAVRHLASSYPYDHGEPGELTLRGGADEVSVKLRQELQERLARAGVTIEDARLTHLAYAPEIAQAMLRRQQAEAVIAAREMLVAGAVGMVEMALKQLSERNVITLDDERKAAMVSNLLVVLCGETDAQPVINTGTLYQ